MTLTRSLFPLKEEKCRRQARGTQRAEARAVDVHEIARVRSVTVKTTRSPLKIRSRAIGMASRNCDMLVRDPLPHMA